MSAQNGAQRCVFCDIVVGTAPANVAWRWDDAIAITPLRPVTPGHLLVIPRRHVSDFAQIPEVSAATMRRAAELARDRFDPWQPMNLITSRGHEATQTVFHLHVHLVPRREGDGLALPWHAGKDAGK